jgi:hypothetical protein
LEDYGNLFQRLLFEKCTMEISSKGFDKIQWKFLPKVFEKVFFSLKSTMEISSQGFEKVFKNDAQTGPIGRANLFTGAFGKQYELVLIITSRTKPEIR